MSWLICGTIPDKKTALLEGRASFEDGRVKVSGESFPAIRGSLALIAASCLANDFLGLPMPHVMLAGDEGQGEGSRTVYARLCEGLDLFQMTGLTFHYLLPDVDWQLKILLELEKLENPPLLVADAGYMYAVKMSGSASSFDLFTPDAGEMAFLADEEAPHPFYTRGFLLADEGNTPGLISRAYKTGGAAKNLLVKGKVDYVITGGQISSEIKEPSVPAMEAIGGTGDTITGMVSSLLDSGLPMAKACKAAALGNRLMAQKANPNPATQVADLLEYLRPALEEALSSSE